MQSKGLFTRNEIESVSDIQTVIILCRLVYRQYYFLSIYQAMWVTDPFAPKLYSLIQNNIDPNIIDGLNFVACEQTLMQSNPFLGGISFGRPLFIMLRAFPKSQLFKIPLIDNP